MDYQDVPMTEFDRLRQRITFALGKANEWVVARELEDRGYKVQRERSLSKGIDSETSLEGHTDLTCDDALLYELKSVSSLGVYQKIFIDGEYKTNNLAQLVTYLMLDNKTEGILQYTNFIYSPAVTTDRQSDKFSVGPISPGYRKFMVTLDPNTSAIWVDNKPTPFTLDHVRAHYRHAAKVVKDQEVSEIRPSTSKACGYCKLYSICTSLKKGDITDAQWLALAKGIFTKSTTREEMDFLED
jgi:hypothetical protein